MSPALEATGLGVRYGRTWALRDCSLAVPAGRVAALVGPNGAGKTTLMHAAVGLLRPAMALVVAGVAVTMFSLFQLSDYYAEPARTELSGTVLLDDHDARLVSTAWVEPSGKEVAEPSDSGCPRRVDVGQSSRNADAWQECLFSNGYRYAVYYHPPSRFWRFQWTEAGILTLASAALGGLAVRRTLRRPG